jgi:HEAT repeat protein
MIVPIEPVSARRAAAAISGHSGDIIGARQALNDPEASIRCLGYGALSRLGALDPATVLAGFQDSDTRVVRRVIECVAQGPGNSEIDAALVDLIAGGQDVVAETAAWALGERHQPTEDGDEVAPGEIIRALIVATTQHDDALVRESAAAALGAIGHPDGLPAILIATQDKATVRRRAVLALAAFDGPEVTEALTRARTDRDWQVRQAAEDLLGAT